MWLQNKIRKETANVTVACVLLQSMEGHLCEIELPREQERNFNISLAEAFNAARACKDRIALQNNYQIQTTLVSILITG